MPSPLPPAYNCRMLERLKRIWRWLFAAAVIFILVALIAPAVRKKWIRDHARDHLDERYFNKRVR